MLFSQLYGVWHGFRTIGRIYANFIFLVRITVLWEVRVQHMRTRKESAYVMTLWREKTSREASRVWSVEPL